MKWVTYLPPYHGHHVPPFTRFNAQYKSYLQWLMRHGFHKTRASTMRWQLLQCKMMASASAPIHKKLTFMKQICLQQGMRLPISKQLLHYHLLLSSSTLGWCLTQPPTPSKVSTSHSSQRPKPQLGMRFQPLNQGTRWYYQMEASCVPLSIGKCSICTPMPRD